MIGKGFVTQTAFKKHLDGDWRTVHELWSHIRNYMGSYAAPAATTYTKTEVDAFFEGYSGGKAQVDAGNVVGLTQGSIPFADSSGFLTEDNTNLFWDETLKVLEILSPTNNTYIGKGVIGGGNSVGNNNVLLGYEVGYSFVAAHNNTFVGYLAGRLNTGADEGALFGYYSGYYITSSSQNACFGAHAGKNISTGQGRNACFGYNSGGSLDIGYFNTLIGAESSGSLVDGYGNTCIGYNSGVSATAAHHRIAIGYYASSTEDYLCVIGGTGANAVSLAIFNQKEFRFYDNGNYVGFKAPALSANKIWVLPNADGATDQAIKTDGSATLGWQSYGMKTSGAWSKSIGSGGDYADWATMIAAMPDLIAHEVTVTIEKGTTLTEICNIKNKHALTVSGKIVVKSERYYPTDAPWAGTIPTADSATATTLRDAVLAAEGFGDDYFNGCWIFIVHGTGTDNGYVPITDYVDATGDVVVANWPGTRPDNTSRYIIVGALIDAAGARAYGFDCLTCTCPIELWGIGMKSATSYNLHGTALSFLTTVWCGFYDAVNPGIYVDNCNNIWIWYGGIVKNNTGNNVSYSGVFAAKCNYIAVLYSGISDNLKFGIVITSGTFADSYFNFGDGNGAWGTWATHSGQVKITGTECSGAAGNHSDPGTAGNANADQASAY